MCRVHGEATECVVFMGRQRNASCSSGGNGMRGSQPAGSERNAWSCSSGGLGRNRRWKRGLAYRKTEETDLLRSERGPIDREGCGVPQNGGNGLVLERYGRNGGPLHRVGCGVPQNGTPRDTVHLHCQPPLASTGYCSSTVDLLQPPPASVHPRALFIQPPPRATPPATIQPPLSTGSYSTTPPWATIHPALHRLLFNQPSTGSSCSSSSP